MFKKSIKQLLDDESGMGTIEIVIIVAVLIVLAFLFRGFATGYFKSIIDGINKHHGADSLFSCLRLWNM